MTAPEKRRKTEKFDIRLSSEEHLLIKQAAALRRTTPTSFIREQAVVAASDVLHEQTRFVLTEEQWKILNDSFAQPPRILKKLAEKLTQPDLWDA